MDRKVFFDAVRKSMFGGRLTPTQVTGLDLILNEAQRRATPRRWLAYMLATAFHETSGRMEPVIETRQANEDTNPSVDEAIRRLDRAYARGRMPWVKTIYWRKDENGLSWLGRGLPQITHERNYRVADQKLGLNGALLKNPDLALRIDIAIPIMFRGMEEGWFTGKSLRDYLGNGLVKPDYLDARRIINGTESAAKVRGYAVAFEVALSDAGWPLTPDLPLPKPEAIVVAPEPPKPIPVLDAYPAEPKKESVVSKLLDFIKTIIANWKKLS